MKKENTVMFSPNAAGELLKRSYYRLKNRQRRHNAPEGLPTMFGSLDQLTSGFAPGSLSILAGRPGMGCTSLALNICFQLAFLSKVPVTYYSLDQPKESLMDSCISLGCKIPRKKIDFGNLTKGDLKSIHQFTLQNMQCSLVIDDTPNLALDALQRRIIGSVESGEVRLIIIDYLQLINTHGLNNYTIVVRELSELASTIDVPILLLSHLSSTMEKGVGDKKPIIQDLHRYGHLYPFTDIILFLHRPEYYGIKQSDYGLSLDGKAEIIVVKNEFGSLGSCMLNFNRQFLSFSEL